MFGRKKEKSFEEKVEERLKELDYTRERLSVENQIRKEEEAVRMAKMRCAIKHKGYNNAIEERLKEEVNARRLKNPVEIDRVKKELTHDFFKAEAAISREREESIQAYWGSRKTPEEYVCEEEYVCVEHRLSKEEMKHARAAEIARARLEIRLELEQARKRIQRKREEEYDSYR